MAVPQFVQSAGLEVLLFGCDVPSPCMPPLQLGGLPCPPRFVPCAGVWSV